MDSLGVSHNGMDWGKSEGMKEGVPPVFFVSVDCKGG